MRQALCTALVIVGNNDCWEERHKLMAMLLETMTTDLRRLAASGGQSPQDAASVVSRTFHSLADLVENSQAENTWGRKLLCSSLQVRKFVQLSIIVTYFSLNSQMKANYLLILIIF